MEHGSQWPSWARGAVPDAIVLAQQAQESALAFATRAVRRLGALPSHQRLETAVVSVADDVGQESCAARALVVQVALRCMADSGSAGSVVLSANELAGDELRHELVALVGAVCERLDTRGSITIRFGRPETATSEQRWVREVFDTTAQVIST